MSEILLAALRAAVLGVFAVLASRLFVRWRRGGGTPAAWLGASFAVLAAVTLIGIINADGLNESRGSWPWKGAAAIIGLFPAFLTEFTASFRHGGRRLVRFCRVATALLLVWIAVLPPELTGSRSPFFTAFALAFVLHWTVLSLLSAGWLWVSAGAEPAIARRRMRTLAAGSLLINVAVVTRALTVPGGTRAAQVAVQFLLLGSGWLFFVGFTPPPALRAWWRRRELVGFHRAQAELITALDAEAVGRVIVAQATALLGMRAACLTTKGGRVLASEGTVDDDAPGVMRIPVRDGYLAIQASPATPFFELDENDLLAALCNSAGLALERAELVERDRLQREALEEAARKLAHQALHDSLTGLPNRALLLDRLAQAAARAGRDPAPLALLFLDLDGFKFVNDTLGHRAGDDLLKAVANRLVAVVRPGDTVARFGGDEFVVLCENMPGRQEAVDLAERIAEVLARPATISGQELKVTVSIGIVLADAALVSADDLLRDADLAMYQAKEGGRDRYALFDALAPLRWPKVSPL